MLKQKLNNPLRVLGQSPAKAFIMQHYSDLISICALAISGAYVAVALRQMFRTPKTLTVTRKDTGKTVVLNTQAGWHEGSKLTALL
ncbi:MAG: hypothetical protein M3Y54_07100 [Bacteroidota bacterium]|nr:hypothetical protein [Bacteroidota bacterium]